MSEVPIRTNVGAAGYGENFVRGRSIRDELAGCGSRWDMLVRIVGGRGVTAEDAALLDDLVVAAFSPDPRIWPMKLGWLVASHGDWWAGAAAVQAMLAESRMGPWACGAAVPTVHALVELRRASPYDFPARAAEWARAQWAARATVWGFGVAGGSGRPRDERMALIDAAVRRHERHLRPHYRAALEGAEAIEAATARPPNMALQIAAVALDLGLDRRQIEAVVYEFVEPQILGNAFEAARMAPAAMRELPESAVRYGGPSSRVSSRARGDG